jgi:hypothetical protein
MRIMETKTKNPNDIYQLSVSFRRHQRQRFWQILAPVILGGLITLAAAMMMVLTLTETVTGVNLSQTADTSLIWLILPVMAFGILFAGLLFGLVYGVAQLLNILPKYTFLIQQYAALIEAKTKLWTIKGISPIISLKSAGAAVSAFFSGLFAWMKE